MKYIEFRKIMEDKGFKVEEFIDYISVYTITGLPVAKIGKDFEGVVDLDFSGYVDLDLEERQMIAQKVMGLSFTELEDREDVEERNIYKLKGFEDRYLNKCITKTGIVYDVLPNKDEIKREGIEYRTLFTDMEFIDMPKEVWSHNWEKIEGDL